MPCIYRAGLRRSGARSAVGALTGLYGTKALNWAMRRSLAPGGGNSLGMGQGISRSAVIARDDVQRLMKVFHKMGEPAQRLQRRKLRGFGLGFKDLNTLLNHVHDVMCPNKWQNRVLWISGLYRDSGQNRAANRHNAIPDYPDEL